MWCRSLFLFIYFSLDIRIKSSGVCVCTKHPKDKKKTITKAAVEQACVCAQTGRYPKCPKKIFGFFTIQEVMWLGL